MLGRFSEEGEYALSSSQLPNEASRTVHCLEHEGAETSSTDKRGAAAISSIPLRLLGYGVLMGWHFLILFYPAPVLDDSLLPSILLQRQLVLNGSLCLFFLVFGWLIDRHFNNKKSKFKFTIAVSAVAVISCLTAFLSLMYGLHVLFIIAVVIIGATEAALMLLWLRFYSETSVNYSGLYLASSMVIGALICFFTRYLVAEISLVVVAILPAISGVMFLFGSQRIKWRDESQAERGIPDWNSARKPYWKSTTQIMICSFMFGVFQGSVTLGGDKLFQVSEPASMLGVGIAGLCVVLTFFASSLRPRLSFVHKLAALLFIGGLMVVPFASNGWAILAATATMTGFIMLELLTLMIIVDISRTFDLKPGKTIGINRAIEYGAFTVGILLGFFLWGQFSNSTSFPFAIATFAAFCSIAVTLLFFLDERSIWSNDFGVYVEKPHVDQALEGEVEPEEVSSHVGHWKTACNTVSTDHGLSPRECEILFLLAKGRNAEYIQNALYISTHTAKTHISNIYRKLEIHSAQELLDMVEDAKARE